MNDTQKTWTIGNIFFLLLFTLDVVFIVFWSVIFFEYYDKISKVISGIWGVITVILSAIGIMIENPKKRSIGAIGLLFGLKVVRILLVVYTFIILGMSTILILQKFEVHKIEIEIPSLAEGTNVIFRWDAQKPDTITKTGTWTFKRSAGTYNLYVKPEEYNYQIQQIDVYPYTLYQKETIDGFSALKHKGWLEIRFKPEKARLEIKTKNKTIIDQEIYDAYELLELDPDSLTIVLSAPGFSIYTTRLVVNSSDTTKLQIDLLRQNGKLTVNSDPDEMEVYIDGRKTNLLTPVSSNHPLMLLPGSHMIMLVKKLPGLDYGYRINPEPFNIRANEITSLSFNDIIAEELCEFVLKSDDHLAEYYLDDKQTILGSISGEKTIRGIFPGPHTIIKTVNGKDYRFEINLNKVKGNRYHF